MTRRKKRVARRSPAINNAQLERVVRFKGLALDLDDVVSTFTPRDVERLKSLSLMFSTVLSAVEWRTPMSRRDSNSMEEWVDDLSVEVVERQIANAKTVLSLLHLLEGR